MNDKDVLEQLAKIQRETCASFGFRYLHDLAAYTAALEQAVIQASAISEWALPWNGGENDPRPSAIIPEANMALLRKALADVRAARQR